LLRKSVQVVLIETYSSIIKYELQLHQD
jgi:hypothetical protein